MNQAAAELRTVTSETPLTRKWEETGDRERAPLDDWVGVRCRQIFGSDQYNNIGVLLPQTHR